MAEFKDLLIEIGTEELPPAALRTLRDAFQRGVTAGLEGAGIGFKHSSAYATPRRLAVVVDALADRQPDQTIERKGPAIQAAYDAEGQPTKAAEGFARSCGVGLDALETMETDKGAWLVYRGEQAGERTTALLPAIIHAALDALPIPKRMRWGSSDVAFVRPVHWSIVLFGDEVVEMPILGTSSGRTTRGHRFHAPQPLTLSHGAEYAERLEREGYVIADLARRRDTIAEEGRRLATTLGGALVADDALLDEVAALVEWPVAMVGSFDQRFLKVPAEALISSMQGHQKVFPVRGGDGALLPRFIMIANLESYDPDEVVRGNERVIRPRLADAEFFWNQDRRQALADRIEGLKGIVFQQRLGSLHDKQQRVATLAGAVADRIGVEARAGERAALLAKCDLLTEMVDEFPELQGIMGRYYARHDGEDPEIAAAMEEQYQPRFAGDDTPQSPVGQVLAIADRVDTLVGIFAIGQGPTGDKDPFALRRAALGLMRTLIERERSLPLRQLFGAAAAALPEDVASAADGEAVLTFCLDRLKRYYQEQGIGAEVFDAVAALDLDDPLDIHHRLQACARFLELDAAESLAAANKRVRNILRKSDEPIPGEPDPALFAMAEERALADAMAPLVAEIDDLAGQGHYGEALERLATLREVVDRFFDGVMVMAEDAAVRANRLALLQRLAGLFTRVADISRLPAGGA
ncbi:glycine--tRNA ligase subunit beta [Aquisalimonas sp. 2447]|uniref:glycine--tRNA ligase subunit beta n=1 Tax=Aquisalimonas sp. 2447 TaxID=2740807 RepID=UPI0014323DA2|nr:glycine--tRNA ligase subunit beta [Aquisalimonas sp. 2447]QIT53746.1 glycine--tRNA ligase subunit beta [Aquisalimonas sp. 2447]